jgi:hypothetical protein
MPRIIFDENTIDWEPFFASQKGNGYWFEGMAYQRGYGFGSVILTLGKLLWPIAKTIAADIGMAAAGPGKQVFKDVLHGENVAASLKKGAKEGMKNIEEKLNATAQAQKGSGGKKRAQKGGKKKKESSPVVGRLVKGRVDYLGAY